MPLVTLTTDFGTRDGYVGAMKGVLASLAPEAIAVDIAHDVPRHDIAHGAWVLANAAFRFPGGTIHLAVVDPGVGGARAEVIVQARGHLFVGPDNGLFAHVGRDCDGTWAITSPAFRESNASATFHGRDVFAPAAAALARGLPPHLAGPATCLAGQLPWPAPEPGAGAVVHIDVYGNLITDLPAATGDGARVEVLGHALPMVRTYADVDVGALCAYVGSMGTVEIAVRQGSAARILGAGRGTAVRLL